jgi:hypothetical protein
MLKEKDLVIGAVYMPNDVKHLVDYIVDMGDLDYTEDERQKMEFVLDKCTFELKSVDSESVKLIPRCELGFGALVIDKEDALSLFRNHHKVEHVNDDGIEKFIYSGNTTVCILEDGTKGITKLKKNDKYDEEKGKTVALLKAKRTQALEEKNELDGFIKFLTRELGHSMQQKEKAAKKAENLLQQIKKF